MIKVFFLVLLLMFSLFRFAYAVEVTLIWTAPADDAGLSTESDVTAYKLVYSLSPITEGNFDSATEIATGVPKPRGQTETYIVDLPFADVYYFAIKSVDVAGNWSQISNIRGLLLRKGAFGNMEILGRMGI